MFKTTKRALAVLLAVLMLVCYVPFASFAEEETEPATSGTCGTTATWTYDAETKTLTISGTGATNGYTVSAPAPWSAWKAEMKTVVINGISEIGSQFLYTTGDAVCAVEEVTLPETLEKIGNLAFEGCSNLKTIVFPKSLKSIGAQAFRNCTSLEKATYAGTVKDWAEVAVSSNAAINGKLEFHTHDYANPVFDWSSTGEGEAMVWSATQATFTCACGATIDVPATVAQATTNPKCTENGSIDYTATTTPTAETYGEGEDAITIGRFENETYTESKTVTIDATGHSNPLTPVAESPANCTAAGTAAYWYCATCNQKFADEAGTQPIDNPAEIPALGHDFVTEGENVTLRSDGKVDGVYKHSYKCSRCNEYGAQTECTFGDWVDTATCLVGGTKTRECACGNSESTATDPKPHDFSKNAKDNGDNTHSFQCANGCGAYSTEKKPHTWDEGVVTPPADCTTDGYTTFTCKDCGATKQEPITAAGHDLAIINHDITEKAGGGYSVRAYTYCKTCNKTFDETKDAELVVIEGQEPTCSKTGRGYYYVKFNETNLGDYTFDEIELPKAETVHSMTPIEAKAADCTNAGWNAYWVCEDCKKLFSDEKGENQLEAIPYIQAKGHTNEIIPGTPASCLEDGLTDGVKCSVCGVIITAQTVIPATGHTPAAPVVENNVGATCTETGSYDSVVYCATCDAEISRERKTNELGQHDLSKTDKEDATCTEPGTEAYWTCSVCKQLFSDEKGETVIENPIVIEKLGHNFVTGEGATLRYDGENKHSYKCSRCNEYGAQTACEFSAWSEDTATCQAPGEQTRTCACGNSETKTTNPKQHDFSADPRDNGDGTHSYKCANGCGQYSVAKEEHSFTEWGNNTATCTKGGTETRTCRDCGRQESRDTTPIPHRYTVPEYKAVKTETGYDVTASAMCSVCLKIQKAIATAKIIAIEGKEPTCSATGEGTYVAKFENELFEDYTVLGEDGQPVQAVIAKDPNAHKLSPVEKKDATCEEDGYEAYWKCDLCGVMFKADEATEANKIEAPITIGKTGHAWGTPSYTWNLVDGAWTCTATRTCANADHPDTEMVTATSKVTTEPTCEAKGKTTYTATFTNPAFETQTKEETDVNPLGHDWGEVTYTWADDNSTVTATRACKREGCGATEIETANATGEITTTATCMTKGVQTFTSDAFTNEAFSVQTKKVDLGLDENNHSFTNYVSNGDATYNADGTKTATCDYGCGTTKTIPDEGTQLSCKNHIYTTKDIAPTCEKEGTRIFTCTLCGHEETETLAKLQHEDKNNDGKCDNGCGQMMTGGNHCKYCGKIHDGLFGWLVGFFHSILAIFKR